MLAVFGNKQIQQSLQSLLARDSCGFVKWNSGELVCWWSGTSLGQLIQPAAMNVQKLQARARAWPFLASAIVRSGPPGLFMAYPQRALSNLLCRACSAKLVAQVPAP